MTESPWSRRNLIIIAAIVVVAVVIIAVTAVMTSGSSSSSDAAPAEPAPDFESMLVDEQEISSLMGGADMKLTYGDNRLNTPLETSTNPAECSVVSSFADSWEYADTPWRAARIEEFDEDEGDFQAVEQAVVMVDTQQSAQGLFDRIEADWDKCNGQTYVFPASDATWKMSDFTATPEMLLAVSVVDGETGDWTCQRAFGIRSVYIAEARVCGYGSGQAEKIVDEILSGVEA